MPTMPLVSIITPTTHDRESFNERCRAIVASQDYPNIEHLFDYDAGTVGDKRNRLCERAKGTIILHMDSDDWYAPDWVSRSVAALDGCELTGLCKFNFHNYETQESWQYTYPPYDNMAGATLCYTKDFWESKRFNNKNVGEDVDFVNKSKFIAHNYVEGFIATIHSGNTSPKNTTGERWKLIYMLVPELMHPIHISTV